MGCGTSSAAQPSQDDALSSLQLHHSTSASTHEQRHSPAEAEVNHIETSADSINVLSFQRRPSDGGQNVDAVNDDETDDDELQNAISTDNPLSLGPAVGRSATAAISDAVFRFRYQDSAAPVVVLTAQGGATLPPFSVSSVQSLGAQVGP